MNERQGISPLPKLSLGGAIAFGFSLLALLTLELWHTTERSMGSMEDHRSRVFYVMVCVLLAAWSSIVSLVTAWCPVILSGDRRPLLWVIPLVLGWIVFVQWYDWSSLVPRP